MSVLSSIEEARQALEQLLRKWKFKKANAEREDAATLQAALAMCRGKLELCKKDFDRIIREQSKNITEGISIGADTTVQERILCGENGPQGISGGIFPPGGAGESHPRKVFRKKERRVRRRRGP